MESPRMDYKDELPSSMLSNYLLKVVYIAAKQIILWQVQTQECKYGVYLRASLAERLISS